MSENGEKTKILVVDDEGIITMQVSKLLIGAGYDVVGTAADGGEAVRMADEHEPDIVLMDLIMPGVHGLHAIPQIHQSHPETTIIVLTALQSKGVLTEALDAGARDYILKPFTKQDMLDMIKKYAN